MGGTERDGGRVVEGAMSNIQPRFYNVVFPGLSRWTRAFQSSTLEYSTSS